MTVIVPSALPNRSPTLTKYSSPLFALIRPIFTVFEISPLTQAAILASYVHAKAGEKASKELTEYSVMASDLLNYIPKALLEL